MKKYHIAKILLILYLLLSYNITVAQEEDYNGFDVKLSPRITIGYTFGAGVNCGIDLGVSVYKLDDIMAGLHINYYFVFLGKRDMHKIRGIQLAAETKYVGGRIGFGRVSRSWGLRNINKAGVNGLIIDASVGIEEYKAPWIGFKTFIFNRQKWMYYDLPSYTSLYAYFKTQDTKIYKQDPPPPPPDDDDDE